MLRVLFVYSDLFLYFKLSTGVEVRVMMNGMSYILIITTGCHPGTNNKLKKQCKDPCHLTEGGIH